MRTTIDIPDTLYRKTKAIAALEASSFKDLVIHALEHEIRARGFARKNGAAAKLPRIHLRGGRKLDLSNFDFDDLLG